MAKDTGKGKGSAAKKTTGDQKPSELPDLGADTAAAAAAQAAEDAEAAEAAEAEEAERQRLADEAEADGGDPPKPKDPVFNARQQFSMIWHDGLQHYYQNGHIFDRGSKKLLKA